MAILHVRNVPDDLYIRIQELARAEDRSISAEVITLLQQGLREDETRRSQARILGDIRRRRFPYPADANAPNSVTLLREDRER